MTVLVATTTAAFIARSDPHLVLRWLEAAEQRDGVEHFAALEAPPQARAAFEPLLDRLTDVDGTWWWFTIEDGRPISSQTRIHRICAGRNLIIERALTGAYSHVLFLDADLAVPPDSCERLAEVDWPVVGGDVPAYCLSGPAVPTRLRFRGRFSFEDTGQPYGFPVQRHWNTAGFLLVRTEVLSRVRWGYDPRRGLTDDPWFAERCEHEGFGPTLVRKDVVGEHEPLVPLEERGLDLSGGPG